MCGERNKDLRTMDMTKKRVSGSVHCMRYVPVASGDRVEMD